MSKSFLKTLWPIFSFLILEIKHVHMITYNWLLIHLYFITSFTFRNFMGMFLHWQYWMKLRRVTNTFLCSTASARSDLKLQLLWTFTLIIPNSDLSVANLPIQSKHLIPGGSISKWSSLTLTSSSVTEMSHQWHKWPLFDLWLDINP